MFSNTYLILNDIECPTNKISNGQWCVPAYPTSNFLLTYGSGMCFVHYGFGRFGGCCNPTVQACVCRILCWQRRKVLLFVEATPHSAKYGCEVEHILGVFILLGTNWVCGVILSVGLWQFSSVFQWWSVCGGFQKCWQKPSLGISRFLWYQSEFCHCFVIWTAYQPKKIAEQVPR